MDGNEVADSPLFCYAFGQGKPRRIPCPSVSHSSSHSSNQHAVGSGSGGETETVRVLYVGRLSREKGVDVLLRAWALLVRAHEGGGSNPQILQPAGKTDGRGRSPSDPPSGQDLLESCSLTIVGDGPERPALETLAESSGISDLVEFTGALPHDEALAVLKTASLLVLPSVCYEQFAITPLEAMTFGVPTLTSDVARYGTIIEKGVTGQFFAAGDPEALADALRDLLAAPDVLRRMGEAARMAFQKSDCIPSRNLLRLLSIYASCGAVTP